MIEVIPFEKLGRFENDWLRARHHFSFGSYFDPSRLGFGSLRVLERRYDRAGQRLRSARPPGHGNNHLRAARRHQP